jgi:cobalt-zinc-cadmium efflux system membrane fusion protein
MFPGDAERVRVGQPVEIRSVMGNATTRSQIKVLLPTADLNTQALLAHVELPNQGAEWRPGMGVDGAIVVSRQSVPLAVRTRALQRFRDFTVVYMKLGETYEVRMLQLGRQTAEWTEVLGGLEPGTEYVTDNAFLIRADVEKSGATHDH